MRVDRVSVVNLRAIKRFEISELSDFIVIAGPNGSGKSCVLDAIRLLKSVYGGQQVNEYMQWMSEFAINLSDPVAIRRLFRDPEVPIEIEAELQFADSEIEYLKSASEELVLPLAWQMATGQVVDPYGLTKLSLATQYELQKEKVDPLIEQLSFELREALDNESQSLRLLIPPNGTWEVKRNVPAQIAFQTYEPEHLGIIDYHSATRSYNRQGDIGGVNLDIGQFAQQRRQSLLYNSQNKYQNIKSELATEYLLKVLAEKSGRPTPGGDLNETLSQMFQTFFPDKKYLGVQLDENGKMKFPVQLATGEIHDIDELSSGEKEVIYGYLRLRNATPKNSVILLDEPELHLNPSIMQGFAQFYYERLGLDQGNQIWMVTHSDTLLRQAVGNPHFSTYHMIPAGASGDENQATPIEAAGDVERAVLSLVGDLANYRPAAKVVILEGENVNGFDVTLVSKLFPSEAQRLNLVAVGDKHKVKMLWQLLKTSTAEVVPPNTFFAIVDRDFDGDETSDAAHAVYNWDVYHIENYLMSDLSPVLQAIVAITGQESFANEGAVKDELKDCARELIRPVASQRVVGMIQRDFLSSVSIGVSRSSTNPPKELQPSIEETAKRIEARRREYDEAKIQELLTAEEKRLEASISDGSWITVMPGREILKRFAGRHLGGFGYEYFANIVLDKMLQSDKRPQGMKDVLDSILEA